MLRRFLALVYGGVCYAAFLAVAVYGAGFIVGLATPTGLDGAPARPLSQALLIDLGLLAAFALQHSGMARPTFKRWWTRIVPEWAERSTYVLVSSVAMIAMFVLWEPIGAVVWSAAGTVALVILGLNAVGWLVLLYATFLIDHFDLFGLRQVYANLRSQDYAPVSFRTPSYYKLVRHPIYLGFILAFWATPAMTAGHLLFAVATTGYIFVGIYFEERDLVAFHGTAYIEYRQSVRMIVPIPAQSRTAKNPGRTSGAGA
jgi:methanethiol S-methyltransferase